MEPLEDGIPNPSAPGGYSSRDWDKMGLPNPASPKGRRDLYDILVGEGYKHTPKEKEDWRAQRRIEGGSPTVQNAMPTKERILQANVLSALEADIERDMVNLPEHYARFKIEPIRFIGENGLNWWQGNILKYMLRYDAKNGMEDLLKAKRYMDMFIEHTKGNPDWWKVGKPV